MEKRLNSGRSWKLGARSNLYSGVPEEGEGKGILCTGRINLLFVTGGIEREHLGRWKEVHSLEAVN